jgi:hypothetical protein
VLFKSFVSDTDLILMKFHRSYYHSHPQTLCLCFASICVFALTLTPSPSPLFYFKGFRSFDRTLLKVIGDHEPESKVGFSTPRPYSVDQSETSSSILRVFEVLIELCYRLSRTKNPNVTSDFRTPSPLPRKPTNPKQAFLF